jgi:hypothetical protein
MYCPSCGKTIPEESKFCLHCGKPTTSLPQRTQPKIEYDDFVITYDYKGQWGFAWTKLSIARDYWQNLQAEILPKIQNWLDEGWEPISEVGLSGFKIEDSPTFVERLFDQPMQTKTLVEFRVKMRRQIS